MKKGKKFVICCSILLFFIIIGIILYGYYNNKQNCGPKHKVKWQDSQCYEKCMDGCSYKNCNIYGWDCGNACTLMCETPKYENCISKCDDPKIDGYDKQHYKERYIENRDKNEETSRGKVGNISLPEEDKYDERIEDIFPGYKEEIEKYESCKSTCGEEPRIIPWN